MDKLGFVSKHKKGTESREEEEEKENKYAKLGLVALSLSWNKTKILVTEKRKLRMDRGVKE